MDPKAAGLSKEHDEKYNVLWMLTMTINGNDFLLLKILATVCYLKHGNRDIHVN